MVEVSEIVDISTLCRVCLEEAPKLYPLTGPIINVDQELAAMIAYCIGEEVELGEDLPNNVCVSCFRRIRIAYNLILEFRDTNKQLLELRESNEVKQEQSQEGSSENEVLISEVTESFSNQDGNEEGDIYGDVIKTEINEMSIDEILNELGDETQVMKLEVDEYEVSDTQPTKIKKSALKAYQCPVCWKTVSKFNATFLPHLYTHKDAEFSCTLCESTTKVDLKTYVAHYKGFHLYQCPICHRSLNNKSSYSYHLKKHDPEKTFVCPHKECGRKFTHFLNLKRHVHLHTDSKYVCSKCGKISNSYDTFRYHMKTHDGKRNFLCTVCGQAFLQSSHMKAHMWKHTGIKRFRCKKCSKRYTSITQLKKHFRKYCGADEVQNSR